MATIFVDEAGYTGTNFLDPAQPVFVLSTHDFEESEARKLKNDFFGFTKASSLKFTQLSRKPKGQAAILAFLREMLQKFPNRFGTHLVHKPFTVLCKLVDHVVETSMHNHGTDLYARGGNIALCNAIYYVTKSLGGDGYLDRLLAATQKLFVDDSFAGAMELMAVLEEKTGLISGKTPEGPLEEFLSIPQLALMDVGPRYIAQLDKDDLQISMAVALVVMAEWGERHGGNLDVIHDQSSVMLRKFDEWARVTAGSVEQAVVGMDRRTMRYPIGVKSTSFEPDEAWAGLQLADVVAGALFKAAPFMAELNANKPTSFDTSLIEIMKEWPLVDNLWPAAKFTPQELGTEGPKHRDPFDFYEDLVAPK